MRWMVIAVMVMAAACKSGDKPGTPSGGPASADKPVSAGGGGCTPMTGMCKRFPAADLGKVFETPALTTTENNQDDGPMGSLDDCAYKQNDDKVTFDVLVRYECFKPGVGNAPASFKGIRDAMTNSGLPVEDVPGVGDEAFWRYSAGTVGFIQGGVKVRKDNVIVTVDYGSYRIGGKPIDTPVAKQRATDVAKRVLAALP